jgi:hypothetical protein
MKLNVLLSIAVAASACGGAATQANHPEQFQTERVHEAGRVKLWIPPGWAVDDTTADTLVITSPDHTVSLEVTVLDAKDLAGALVALAAAALIGYDDLQLVGAPQGGTINGMNALFQDGQGNYHGTSVALSVGVIDTPAEKFLLVVGEAETAAFAAHAGTIRDVMNGIKPL